VRDSVYPQGRIYSSIDLLEKNLERSQKFFFWARRLGNGAGLSGELVQSSAGGRYFRVNLYEHGGAKLEYGDLRSHYMSSDSPRPRMQEVVYTFLWQIIRGIPIMEFVVDAG
jgi:hypothetical protein